MLHTALTTWNLHAPDMETKLAFIASLGCRTASLLHTVPPSDVPAGDARHLAALLERHGLDCIVHGAIGACDGDLGEHGLAQGVASQIDRVAAFQRQTGLVQVMTFDPGYGTASGNRRVFDLEGSLRTLDYALRELAPLGVRVGLENWGLNHSLDQWQSVARRLQHEALGCLLDLGHLHIAWHRGALEGRTPAEFIAELPLPIWEIHVHDNDGVSDQHRPLGEGHLPMERMGRALRQQGFGGCVTAEVIRMHTRHPGSPATLRRTLRRALAALREV